MNTRTRYALLAVLLVGFTVLLSLDILQDQRTVRMDFRSFYTAWEVAASDAPDGNVYDVTLLQAVSDRDLGRARVYPYLYPPTLAVLGAPLSSLSAVHAQAVWNWLAVVLAGLLTALSVATCLRPSADRRRPSARDLVGLGVLGAVLLVTLAFRNNLLMGQVNVIVLACISAGLFAHSRDRPGWAGAALGLAAMIKLWPAVLLALPLARRQWRALYGFALASLAVVAVTSLIGGPAIWGDFVAFATGSVGDAEIPGLFELDVSWNFSLKAYLMRLFGPGAGSTLLTLAGVAGMLVLLVRRARSGVDPARLWLPLLVVMVVSSPVTYVHHMIYLLPGVLLTCARPSDHGPPPTAEPGRSIDTRLVVVIALTILAGTDFPALYRHVHLPGALGPLLTSVNLWALLALFMIGIGKSGDLPMTRATKVDVAGPAKDTHPR